MATDPSAGRRDALVQSSTAVFLRYGYKKTSMEDLARAADISRQGLYLHFPNKEEVFKAVISALVQQSLATMRTALAQDDLPVDERILGAFLAIKSHADGGDMPPAHMNELFATAMELAGPVIADFEQALVSESSRVLQSSGVAARWKAAGLGARDLAQHLQAASHGIKHQSSGLAEYRTRMRVAVRLVCRGTALPPVDGTQDA